MPCPGLQSSFQALRLSSHPRPLKWTCVLLLYVCGYFAGLCVGGSGVCSVCRDEKEALDHLELDLQVVVSCRVGAGIQTQVLWKMQPVLFTSRPFPLSPPPFSQCRFQ